MVDDVPNMNFIEGLLAIFHEVKDISLHKFENEMKFVVLLDDFVYFDDVGMMQFKQRLDFREVDAVVPFLVPMLHLFNGNNLASGLVYRFVDGAECAVAEHFSNFVFIHRNNSN